MVGRALYQAQYPNMGGENNTYSNQLPMKRESHDIQTSIQTIKCEPQTQTTIESCDSKFSGYFGWPYAQEVPQYPVENGIYVSPIEELTNNPYKLQEQNQNDGLSFQKYPMLQEENNNWTPNNDGASYMPQLAFGKKELMNKEDKDILTQLFDLSTMMNNDLPYEIPSHDEMLIPIQTPSPTMLAEPTNQTQTQYQPAEYSPQGYYNQPSNTPHYDNMSPYAVSPDNGNINTTTTTTTIDPLVSVFNEGRLSSPNNDLYPDTETTNNSSDDWQVLLNEILAVENLPIESNAFGPDNCHNDNEILSMPMTPMAEDNNEIGSVKSNEDMSIPIIDTFEFPPPTKKRLSESSTGSSMEESPPPSASHVSPRDPHLSSPLESSSLNSPVSDHDINNPKTPLNKPPRLTTTLFGQKEDEIIDKLLIPKHDSNAKPITRDKLVTMNVEDFNTLLDQVRLTEIEVAFMKEWRRRGKNKMAAQIARKRKRDELSELQDEIDLLRRHKAQLKQTFHSLKTKTSSFKKRAQAAEERIYQKYSVAHGSRVSRDTHNIHVTDDGKTMLVPRVSSQILLV